MSIENLNKNDLLILEESYKVETELEKDALIELLFDKNKKLVEQINTLKHLNNELIGFVKKI